MSIRRSVRRAYKRIIKTNSGLTQLRLGRYWKFWMSQVRLLFDFPCLLVKAVRAMLAAALAAMATFEVILFGKDDISFFRVVEVAFLSGYVAVDGHYTKM